jgi:L-ascorbate metabolism protein UlaG (beta-lactamase superfamily)
MKLTPFLFRRSPRVACLALLAFSPSPLPAQTRAAAAPTASAMVNPSTPALPPTAASASTASGPVNSAGPAVAPTPGSVPALAAPYIFSARRAYVAPQLPDAPPEWVTKSMAWVDIILDAFPPAVDENPARRAALMRLDDVFHLADASSRPQVRAFLQSRVEKALRAMEAAPSDAHPRIWKLYNDGFVVRVDGCTYGFDLIPGVPGRPRGMPTYVGAPAEDCTMTEAQLRRLVAQVDVLFISHLHADHANPRMAAAFLAAHKPVVVPPELWNKTDLASRLLYAPRSVTDDFQIPIQEGKVKLRVHAFPGHQGPVLNNDYLVTTPDGFTVMHTGDQSIPETDGKDFDWLDRIGDRYKVHVLFTDCWYPDVKRLIRSVNPELVITGHENELGHPIDHREDYAQTYERLWGSPYPFVLMTWGEFFMFQRSDPFRFNK